MVATTNPFLPATTAPVARGAHRRPTSRSTARCRRSCRPLPAHRAEPVRDARRPVPLVHRRRHGARRRARRRRGPTGTATAGCARTRSRGALGEPPAERTDAADVRLEQHATCIGHAGRIYSLTEGAMPYELSRELDTMRRARLRRPVADRLHRAPEDRSRSPASCTGSRTGAPSRTSSTT